MVFKPYIFLVPEDGIEPSWGCPRGILLRFKSHICEGLGGMT